MLENRTGQSDDIDSLIASAVDWALLHGLARRPFLVDDSSFAALHLPFALLPSPLSRNQFQYVVRAQTAWNSLMSAAAADEHFVNSIVDQLEGTDAFTQRIHDVYRASPVSERILNVELAIHRVDYMLHDSSKEIPPILKNVEINTFAAGLSHLGSLAADMHSGGGITRTEPPFAVGGSASIVDLVSKAVLFVVQPNEWNMFDQRGIEHELWEKHGVKVVRGTLQEIGSEAITVGFERRVLFKSHEITVAYFRAGYSPSDYEYHQDLCWHARLLLERGRCITCPSAAMQLVGTKKAQQMLSEKGVVERLLSGDASSSALLRSLMAGLYPIDQTPLSRQTVRECIENPTNYVLKPQREGGGNNVYGRSIPPLLASLPSTSHRAFILMDRINCPAHPSIFVRSGKSSHVAAVSELGIFGVWISKGDQVILNEEAGYLVRSKEADSDEGGVSKGTGVIDSELRPSDLS
ncbi:Glutathione synthetase [Gonapodya sp. JEL0774]|nr:Glutathione synthetase [Gonapodya sp. JEL0774]